ncbi:lysozyme [Duganella violaceipulchra]|uniref:Lysozyme n=1 Tax=Duganella violaceipulchra TaxID=2849652 RepID=A0AA41L1X1_9BURK|nr:lysozyme [Duganella violaceicalia]MBV6321493.1 lysozyme [Duganella violaceicalia]MCP2008250.1 lysozyme [Duganella violaceicalia]
MPDALERNSTPVVAGTTNTAIDSVKTGSTARLGKPWIVSENLLQFLGTWENGVMNGKNFAHQVVTNGFILKVYKDSRSLPTVGCGHLVVAADKLKVGGKISEERAKELLKSDLATAEGAVNKNIKVPMHQYEYDALVSLTFNCGVNGASKLFDAVNKGKYELIPATIEKFRTGGGNEARRESEAELFKTGVYDASH